MPDKNKFYITAIVILASIKFIIVPIFSWQSAQLQDIQMLQRQYVKYASVVDVEDAIIVAENAVQQQTLKLGELLPVIEDEGLLLLSNQQALEKIFERNNLKINNFGWQAPIYLSDKQYAFYPADIRMTGKVLDIMTAILDIEKTSQVTFVKDVQINLRNNTDEKLGEFFGVLTIQILSKRSVL